jgi:flagellar protein FliL
MRTLFTILFLLFASAVHAEDISYYSFPEPFLVSISGSPKLVQVNLTLVSEYEPRIYDNVKKHNLAIRNAVIETLGGSQEAEFKVQNRLILAEKICGTINQVLMNKVRFGGIKEILITDIVVK